MTMRAIIGAALIVVGVCALAMIPAGCAVISCAAHSRDCN